MEKKRPTPEGFEPTATTAVLQPLNAHESYVSYQQTPFQHLSLGIENLHKSKEH